MKNNIISNILNFNHFELNKAFDAIFIEALQSVRKNEPCDVIKMRDKRRSGNGRKPIKNRWIY